jgi:hypothetical protein
MNRLRRHAAAENARLLVAGALLVGLVSCSSKSSNPETKPPAPNAKPATSTSAAKAEKALTADERKAAGLPLEGILTLAQPGDTAATVSVPPKVQTAVAAYIKAHHRDAEFRICAARPVGKFLLVWIDFPKIMDGGVDLIYSLDDDCVVGNFMGGIRG